MSEELEHINPLKAFTNAHIDIGLVGTTVPLKYSLEFKLAHAHARDAVYSLLDTERLFVKLKSFDLPILLLQSRASNRSQYLHRPDLGRKLNQQSLDLLNDQGSFDIAIVIADGLSATAINEHIEGLLTQLIPKLSGAGLKIAPLCLAEQARVAIGDDIGHGLKAKLTILLIGERPGLSAADSIGAYLTYNPKPGLTDESRNCVSNIRPLGLKFKAAADKIFYLVQEALQRKLSGVGLKDNAGLLDH
ncbi:MAG: ethanolamine ammonia-lyase subunit EutC [Mucilaginibacter sp.]